MITDILAFWTPGRLELVILIVSVIVYGIPVVLIILFIRYALRNKRENIRLRLEVAKLADELEQLRKQKREDEKGDSSGESG
jgi:hypothetical protein